MGLLQLLGAGPQVISSGGGGGGISIPAPLAFYRMDGASGASETDTVGGLTLASNNTVGSAAGVLGNARTFNGSNQFLNGSDNAVYRISGAWTVAFWAKPSSLPQSSTPMVAKTGNANFPPNSYNWNVFLRSDNAVNFTVSYTGSATTGAISTGTLSTGAYSLVMAWYDPTVTANGTIYVSVNNGSPISSAMGGTPFSDTSEVWVGKSHTNLDRWFAGNIDGLGFWNVVLSSTERTTLYNSGAGREYYSSAWH